MSAPLTRTHAAALATLAVLLAGSAFAPALEAQSTIGARVPVWGPNGRVAALRLDGDTLYVGGSFDQVGPPTGAFAIIDAADATSITTGANLAPSGRSVQPDGAGGFYLFHVPSSTASPTATVLHLTAAGALDPAWSPPVFDTPYAPSAIAVESGRVLVGGYFRTVNGVARTGLVALDGTSGAVLPWNPVLTRASYPPVVNIMATAGGRLYLIGAFDAIGGVARTDVAVLDAGTGALLPGALDASLGHPTIVGIAVSATRVYLYGGCRPNGFVVCGYQPDLTPLAGWTYPVAYPPLAVGASGFYGVMSTAAPPFGQRLMKFDPDTGVAATWTAPEFLSQYTPTLNSVVEAGGAVYIAGAFSQVNGQRRWNVARANATSGALDPWAPVVGGEVTSLGESGGRVAVTGLFNSAGGTGRRNLVAIDLRTGRPAAVQPPEPAFAVWTMTTLGDVMVVGGMRGYGVGGPDLTAFVKSTGAPVPWSLASNGWVNGVASDGRSLYISGRFSELSGTPRLNLAAVSLATGQLTTFNPGPTDMTTIAVSGDALFVAGGFDSLPGYGRGGVGAFDTRTGEVLPFAPAQPTYALSPSVASFAFADTRVLLAGARTNYNEPPQGFEWVDRQSGARSALQSPAAVIIADTSQAGNTVVAVGRTAVGDNTLVLVDAPSGRVRQWSLGDVGEAGRVAAAASVIAVGGSFTTLAGQPAHNLAVFQAPRTGAPRRMTASVVASTVTLGWQPGTDPPASAYLVEVGSTAGGSDIGVFGIGVSTSVSGGLAPGTYYARVRGVGANGPGPAGSEVVVTTPTVSLPPQAPGALSTSVSGGVVTLSWTAAAGNATTYVIEAGTAPGLSNIGTLPLGHLDTAFSTPAPPGTYVVRVRAANAFGVGPASNEVTVVVP